MMEAVNSEEVAMIQIEGITKQYRERRTIPRTPDHTKFNETVTVLDDITISIEKGTFFCLVGPSGCGKSTLLRIIAGFDSPTRGRVTIDGMEITSPSPEHIFVFQEDGLYPWLTVHENMEIGAKRIEDPVNRATAIEEYLEMVGLAGFESHYPHQLSGGMRRRAEVARALIASPKVLFMDEPFGALDFATRLQMREEMLNAHAMFPMTILFITHDIDEALQIGDQVVVLGSRPSKVKMDIKLHQPHPRDIASPELAELRREIYYQLGLHTAL